MIALTTDELLAAVCQLEEEVLMDVKYDNAADDRERFRAVMITALQNAGFTGGIEPADEVLNVKLDFGPQAEKGKNDLLRLDNIYRECRLLPPESRPRAIEEFALGVTRIREFQVPQDLPEAQPKLRLRVATIEGHLYHPASIGEVFVPLGNHLALELTYDLPRIIGPVSDADVARWGLTREAAVDVAASATRAALACRFHRRASGLWVVQAEGASTLDGTYSAARVAIEPRAVAALEVRGRPLVVLPHCSVAFIVGSGDAPALGDLKAQAERYVEEPRFISGIPLTPGPDGGWETYVPPPGAPAELPLRGLIAASTADRYNAQRGHLSDNADLYGGTYPPFVSTVMLNRGDRGQSWETVATWTRGVRALLPKTDQIGFVDSVTATGVQILGCAPWDRVARVMDSAIRPLGLSPERYLVERFPTVSELRRINPSVPGPDVDSRKRRAGRRKLARTTRL